MASSLAKTADEPHPIPNPTADDNLNVNGRAMGSTGVPRPSSTVLHATPEMQRMYSHWMASKTSVHVAGGSSGTTSDAAQPPETLDGSWWEATLPVAGRNLAPSKPNVAAGFTIVELRGIPKEGVDNFVMATSCNGKPLYGACVMDSNGDPRLQQLFEFSQTASDAGVFLPVPTTGGHFHGVYEIDYVRHRFCGSIASLPPLLRCPAPPTSVGRDPSLQARRALLDVAKHSATADTSPTKSITDAINDSSMSPLPSPLQGETPDPSAVSSHVAPPLSNRVSSFSNVRHAVDELQPSLSNAPAPSSNTCERVTPLTTSDTPPPGGVPEPDIFTTTAAPVVTTLSALSKPPPKHLPEYCHPCSLCASCKEFWGMTGLPKESFKDDPFHWEKDEDDDDIPILSSARTAMRKRKWKQSRHGPKSKTSEYRGVNLYKRTWKWESHIWFKRQQLYLGASLTKVHAANVYDRAALFLFGPDAEINFKPEIYQHEYDFMQRLSFGQMVVYLRRESRQNGEEVRYPGVAKVKKDRFSAKYRPTKCKESQELIGHFKTQAEAARAVLQENLRRRNFPKAGELLSIHHLRTIKPAPGKFPVKRRLRAVCIMAALKKAGLDPFEKTPARAKRAAKSKPSTEIGDAALPAEEAATSRPKRQRAYKTEKAAAAAAEHDSADIAPALVSQEASPRQSTKAMKPRRKYTPRKTKAQAQEESGSKRGAKRALPTEDVDGAAPVTEAVETKATPAKRRYTPRKPKAQQTTASKRGTKRALPAEVTDPAPVAKAVKAPPRQRKTRAPARSRKATKSTSAPAAKNYYDTRSNRPAPAAKRKSIAKATSPPAVRKSARVSAAATRGEEGAIMVQECIEVDFDAPSASTASSPVRSRRSLRTIRRPSRYTWVASTPMLPNATPQCLAVAQRSPVAPEESTISIADTLIQNQPPAASESMSALSGSIRDAQMLLECADMYATSAYRGKEPTSFHDSQWSGYASSSCKSFQSPPLSKSKRSKVSYQKPHQVVVEPAKDDAMRQFQEVCERWVIHRRNLHAPLPWSSESNSPAVIRPVARRLPPTNWAPPAATSDATSGAQCSADVLPQGEGTSGGQIYVDLFECRAV